MCVVALLFNFVLNWARLLTINVNYDNWSRPSFQTHAWLRLLHMLMMQELWSCAITAKVENPEPKKIKCELCGKVVLRIVYNNAAIFDRDDVE